MKNKIPSNILFAVIIIILMGLLIYNLIANKTFFTIPVYHWLNLVVAIGFAFYYVQRKNDVRKMKEIMESVVVKIQNSITVMSEYSFDESFEWRIYTMADRSLRSKISILHKNKSKLQIDKEVDYINSKYEEYAEFMGAYFGDNENIKKEKYAMYNKLQLIGDKCEILIAKLYNC